MKEEEKERILYLIDLYNEWLERTEGRGASYGEIAYIQALSEEALEELERGLIKELEKWEA